MVSAWGVSWGKSWGNSWGGLPRPVVPTGGSGGKGAGRRRRLLWEDVRQREREALQRLLRGEDAYPQIQKAAKVLADSEDEKARRLAAAVSAYSGEIDQLQRLQKDIARFELELSKKSEDEALRAAAAELSLILAEDEEILILYQEMDRDNAVLLFSAMNISVTG